MATATMEMEVKCEPVGLAALYQGVRVVITRITPELAAKMLRSNTKNRKLHQSHLRHLDTVFLSGDMILNGQTIIVGRSGILLDGQHRLTSCITTGVPFDALVVYGIDDNAFKTIDGGKKRQTSDVLGIEGEINSTQLASALGALIAFTRNGGLISGSTRTNDGITPSLCTRVLELHPGIRDSVVAMKHQTFYYTQWSILLHYLFGIVDESLANDFVDVLANGSSDIGRPFNVFREHVIRSAGLHDRRERAFKAIKAFNAERSGERPKFLRYSREDDFPTIDGLDMERLSSTVV